MYEIIVFNSSKDVIKRCKCFSEEAARKHARSYLQLFSKIYSRVEIREHWEYKGHHHSDIITTYTPITA